MTRLFASVFGVCLMVGYSLGPIFGLYAAVSNGSFLNAVLSLFIPFYGMVYWFFS